MFEDARVALAPYTRIACVADPDERLTITGVNSGTYDIKLGDKEGRVCMVKGVKVESGQIFSIDDKELTSCNR